MKNTNKRIIRYLSSIILSILILATVNGYRKNITQEKETFKVAFLTDINLQPELNAVKGLSRAIDSVNMLGPDLIITGGDMITDANGVSYKHADSLYKHG